MKLNKWTLGLMAVGLVSLTVNAEEKAVTTPLLTALSSTTISGYVDTSANWTPGTGNANPAPFSFNAGKQDGFNLNAVGIVLEKPLEEGQWSAGYKADFMIGPDAAFVTPGGGAIKQAYAVLRAPVGNGLDTQIGVWDGIQGYEATEDYKNPNYTHSYGYTITPTEYTGILSTYRVSDVLSLKAGVANIENTAGINTRNGNGVESQKTYMGGISLTAPESAGCLKGSVLNASAAHGATSFGGSQVTDLSINATIATPVEGLRLGVAWDEIFNNNFGSFTTTLPHTWVVGAYASFKPAPDSKLSFHARGEYYHGALGALPVTGVQFFSDAAGKAHIWEGTGTIQYDLWQNVISRLEVRWDHSDRGPLFGSTSSTFTPSKRNDVQVMANVIYKF